MANEQNLRPPFPKGKSGNPAGRPKGIPNSKTILQRFLALEEKIDNPVTGQSESMSQLEIMYLKQIAKARKGDLPAMKEVLDRYEGRAKQYVEGEMEITHRYEELTDEELDRAIKEQQDRLS